MFDNEPEFLAIFRDEANELLDAMVAQLLACERGLADERVAIDLLFRHAHTLKGSAGILGLDDIRQLAHAVEDVLEEPRRTGSYPPEITEPLLRAVDVMRAHVEGRPEGKDDLLDELQRRRAGLVRGNEPSPPPPAAFPPAGPAATAPAPAPPADSPLAPLPGVPHELDPDPRAGPSAAAPAPGTLPPEPRRTIRVPADKLDRLLDLVGETVTHRRRLEHALDPQARIDEAVADELDVGDRLLDELKDAAIGMRTLPLSSITGPFPRAVRDMAIAEGKEAELHIVGADTELDRVILESLSEMLVHVLRNAVAHGIEPPADRERAGKPRSGRVELRAEQRGRLVEIVIADDGRGVPREALVRAEREGSLAEVLSRAGFSTARAVSDLAGRGVGLDAVKAQVEGFGGTLEVRSTPGRGTEIVLLLPLALALLEVLLVERGPHVYGLPLSAVAEVVGVGETLSLEGRPMIDLRGHSLALHDIAAVLGAAEPPPLPARPPAVIVSAAGRRVALLCDRLLGEEEVVVRSLGALLARLRGYLGAAILGDGRIALLLDPGSLARTAPRPLAVPGGAGAAVAAPPQAPKVLVVEDSFTVRELQRSILEAAGYRVTVAHDGRQALERLAADAEIELVVTDLEMPELDGLSLTRAIRDDPARAHLPVVIVTSRNSDEDRAAGMAAGADAYMTKPAFDQQALLSTVGRLVGR